MRFTLTAALILLTLGLDPCALRAAQVEGVSVKADGKKFHVTLDAVVSAPQGRVYAVLSDYSRLGRLNPAIRSISVRPSPDGAGERVRSVLDSCVWFFCRQIIQVEDVTRPNASTIAGRVVPGQGDFAEGAFSWRITAEGARTRLRYESTEVAGFWIPPLIGPWVISHTLREQLTSSVVVLERLAN